ncbi:MAG: sulfite reductase [Campylobacterota bacterium]
MDIEKIKKEKDGLDVISDIYIYAVLGEKPKEEDLVRFTWYGIHKQDNSELFTLKIPFNLGEITLKQAIVLSTISKEFSNNKLTITKSQKVELNDIKIGSFPHIFKLLHDVGVNTISESGHNVRNIITCPVNGIDETQIMDVSDLATKLNETFRGNKNFSNLPNSLKIAISGYTQGCSLEFTPDVSFNAYKNKKGKVVFSLRVIGEHLGFVTPSQVVPTARAIAKTYKEFGSRDNFEDSLFSWFVGSWGFSEFFDVLDSTVTFKIKDEDIDDEFSLGKQPRLGINNSKIKDESYIGFKVKDKRVDVKLFDAVLNLLDKYEASKLKITHKGNLIILDAKTKTAHKLALELEKLDFVIP